MAHQNQSIQYHIKISSTCGCIINDQLHVLFRRYIDQPGSSNQIIFCCKILFHCADPYNGKNTNCFLHNRAWYSLHEFPLYNFSIHQDWLMVLPHPVRVLFHHLGKHTGNSLSSKGYAISFRLPDGQVSKQSGKVRPNTAGG